MNGSTSETASANASELKKLIEIRRQALASKPTPAGAAFPAPGPDDPVWGVALSGGGIRSATFCLGLISGLAQQRVFSRFDVMSTVSGGGYAGSAVGKLYTQAADARAVESRLAAMVGTWFVWWLRATSRYLTPRGAKDLLLAAAVYLRNLLAIHVELGLATVVVGASMALFDLGLWRVLFEWFRSHPGMLETAATILQPWMSGWWLALALPMLMGIPLVSGYWTIGSKPDKDRSGIEIVIALLMLLVGAAGIAATWYWEQLLHSQTDGPLRAACGMVSILLLCAAPGVLVAWMARPRSPSQDRETAIAAQRNRLTRYLAGCLKFALVLLVLGLLDRAAWFVAFGRTQFAALLPLVLALGVALARTLAARLPAQDSATAVTGRAGFKLAELAGVLLFALLVTFWASLVYRVALVNLIGPPPRADLLFESTGIALLPFLLVPLGYMALTSRNADFSNLSSLHMFYRARLTRSYLGAANGARFQPKDANAPAAAGIDPLSDVSAHDVSGAAERRSVFEVDPGDTVRLQDYQPHLGGGPVHILNVTINQTYDALGGLFNQDRKGEYLSITSRGLYRIGLGEWTQDSSFADSDLPTWMAISGAAFTPGLGGQTSAGMAILLFMAGVRLGYWWDMGASREKGWPAKLSWTKYKLLGGEARAKFGGTTSRFWYLSDGGHFENTGAYALLREQAAMIVLADAAADPQYKFDDLENLVRKARIDLRTEIQFIDFALAGQSFGHFGSLGQLSDPHSEACIALATVKYPKGPDGWLVYVKPNMFHGLPVDLLNYRRDNPLFPQEPTTDQFFSESQWESYFRLGRELGMQLDANSLAAIVAGRALPATAQPAPTVRPAPAHAPAAQKKVPMTARFSVRTMNLAKSGLSLTALVAVVTAVSQVWDKYSETRQVQRRAYVADVNTALALDERLAEGDSKALPELTSKLASIANTYCHDRISDVPVSPPAARMYADVTSRCNAAAAAEKMQPTPSCAVLAEADVRACMAGGEAETEQPVYWAIDYANAARSRQRIAQLSEPGETAIAVAVPHLTMPAPTPPGAAASAAAQEGSAGAASACAGKLVYLQIYSSSKSARAEAATWTDLLRKKGARVPPVEDVVASAAGQGRQPPRPVAAPTAIYHTEEDHACATELMAGNPSLVPRPMALPALNGVLELWLPPGEAKETATVTKK